MAVSVKVSIVADRASKQNLEPEARLEFFFPCQRSSIGDRSNLKKFLKLPRWHDALQQLCC
ncbi:MAG: hypothetical protein LRZ84_15050 [Desertifilum sp.]|nr:hypothetical protein [Desertifilum sp.]MDI9635489.1 hypothetical protein [Geitlerinema splendidum]